MSSTLRGHRPSLLRIFNASFEGLGQGTLYVRISRSAGGDKHILTVSMSICNSFSCVLRLVSSHLPSYASYLVVFGWYLMTYAQVEMLVGRWR